MNTQPDHFKTAPTKMSGQLDYILLDTSGSMQEKFWDVLLAIDNYVTSIKGEHFDTKMIVSTFDGNGGVDVIKRESTLSTWKPLYQNPITGGWGGTPLYDAIFGAVSRLRDLDPARCTLLIATDGDETGSMQCTEEKAKEMLDWCRAKGWQVIFLGINFNNKRLGRGLGATEDQVVAIQNRKLLSATEKLGKKRANYGLYGTDINFNAEERKDLGGSLLTDQTRGK